MSKKIRLESYSDGELMLSEEYEGTCEKKGRYLRYEYRDKDGAPTHMVVCLDDPGLYRLESNGERKITINCSDGMGKAVLSIGAHSIEGAVLGFKSNVIEKTMTYKTEICYVLSFAQGQKTRTRLIIEAEK